MESVPFKGNAAAHMAGVGLRLNIVAELAEQ